MINNKDKVSKSFADAVKRVVEVHNPVVPTQTEMNEKLERTRLSGVPARNGKVVVKRNGHGGTSTVRNTDSAARQGGASIKQLAIKEAADPMMKKVVKPIAKALVAKDNPDLAQKKEHQAIGRKVVSAYKKKNAVATPKKTKPTKPQKEMDSDQTDAVIGFNPMIHPKHRNSEWHHKLRADFFATPASQMPGEELTKMHAKAREHENNAVARENMGKAVKGAAKSGVKGIFGGVKHGIKKLARSVGIITKEELEELTNLVQDLEEAGFSENEIHNLIIEGKQFQKSEDLIDEGLRRALKKYSGAQRRKVAGYLEKRGAKAAEKHTAARIGLKWSQDSGNKKDTEAFKKKSNTAYATKVGAERRKKDLSAGRPVPPMFASRSHHAESKLDNLIDDMLHENFSAEDIIDIFSETLDEGILSNIKNRITGRRREVNKKMFRHGDRLSAVGNYMARTGDHLPPIKPDDKRDEFDRRMDKRIKGMKMSLHGLGYRITSMLGDLGDKRGYMKGKDGPASKASTPERRKEVGGMFKNKLKEDLNMKNGKVKLIAGQKLTSKEFEKMKSEALEMKNSKVVKSPKLISETTNELDLITQHPAQKQIRASLSVIPVPMQRDVAQKYITEAIRNGENNKVQGFIIDPYGTLKGLLEKPHKGRITLAGPEWSKQ